MEDVVTLEQPNLLPVPLKVEPEFAKIAPISLFNDSHAAVRIKLAQFIFQISDQEPLLSEKNVLSVAFLANFILKRLLELVKLHYVAFFLEEAHYFLQVYILTHLLNESL